jgi:glutamyl-tRNA reductase
VRLHELARITQQLSSQPLSAEQIAAIDRLTKSLTAKLLHPQIAALRDAGLQNDSKD